MTASPSTSRPVRRARRAVGVLTAAATLAMSGGVAFAESIYRRHRRDTLEVGSASTSTLYLAGCVRHPDQGPLATLGGVEPDIPLGNRSAKIAGDRTSSWAGRAETAMAFTSAVVPQNARSESCLR